MHVRCVHKGFNKTIREFEMSINGHFAKNMTGKVVKFDIQPSERGTGIIKNMSERPVRVKEFCSNRGFIIVDYDVYDIEIEVLEGTRTGALYGGVKVNGSVSNTSGKTTTITGVTYGAVEKAVNSGEIIVIARCG